MKAVDTHAGLLRASVASASNDHRLGGHEAPPAVMSIFLGDQLSDIIAQIERGGPKTSKKKGTVEIGVSSLPPLPQDTTDRNRTSPIAYTGNKFEFRAVGSNQNCGYPSMVLNIIIAEALDEICTGIEKHVAAGKEFNESLQTVLKGVVKKHKRILFDGDNYSEEWVKEAGGRGLPNLKKTPEALKSLTESQTIRLFEKYGVLSERELRSRYEVYQQAYDETVAIEARCAVTMAKTMIAPVALRYQGELAEVVKEVERVDGEDMLEVRELLADVRTQTAKMLRGIKDLEACINKNSSLDSVAAMEALRGAVDALEGLVPSNEWPLPTYADMMFKL